jgi:hypothetical protein
MNERISDLIDRAFASATEPLPLVESLVRFLQQAITKDRELRLAVIRIAAETLVGVRRRQARRETVAEKPKPKPKTVKAQTFKPYRGDVRRRKDELTAH